MIIILLIFDFLSCSWEFFLSSFPHNKKTEFVYNHTITSVLWNSLSFVPVSLLWNYHVLLLMLSRDSLISQFHQSHNRQYRSCVMFAIINVATIIIMCIIFKCADALKHDNITTINVAVKGFRIWSNKRSFHLGITIYTFYWIMGIHSSAFDTHFPYHFMF